MSPVTVNTAILRYFIQGLHPFSTVDLSSFKELSSTLQPGSSVITRPTLRSKIAEAALIMKQKVTAAMREVEWIATTVDCWTAHRKSFIGITAYWINPESLERYSAALACKRLNGSHTFEVLASAINDIHSEYEIRDMVVCTTTDSGSNFLKAQEFLEQKTMISRLKQASVKVMTTLILKAVMREVMVWNSKMLLYSWTKMMALNSSYQNIKSVPATYLT